MKNYDTVINYLTLAYKNCNISNETESLRALIKNTIFSFEKLNKKNNKKLLENKKENKKLQYNYPEETLKLIDKWIEQEETKNEINDNQ